MERSATRSYFYKEHPVVFALASLTLTLVAVYFYRVVSQRIEGNPDYIVLTFIATCLVAAALAIPIRYSARLPAYRRLCRAVAAILGGYSLVFYPGFGIANASAYAVVEPLLTDGRWFAIAASIAAWFRPSFLLASSVYVILMKDAIRVASAVDIAKTDYMPIPEMGLFLFFGLFSIFIVRQITQFAESEKREAEIKLESEETALLLILLCAIGIHFANYFISGLQKIVLDGGPLSWALENPTHVLILAGHYLGTLPLGQWPDASSFLFHFMERFGIFLNAATLSAQILTVVAITRIRWIVLTTIFFDLMHFAIFLMTGINFWLWVLLNFAIVATCMALRGKELPRSLRLLPVLFVMFGIAFFHIARLGWYDSRSVADYYFVAVTDKNDEYRVPSNYFLANSYALYHPTVLGVPDSGHFPSGPWGTVFEVQLMREGKNCSVQVAGKGNVDPLIVERLRSFISAHHAYVIKHTDANGRIEYDWYPHHHFTNPTYYRRFYDLDKRKIVGYRFVSESVCLSHDSNGYSRKILRSTSHMFNLK